MINSLTVQVYGLDDPGADLTIVGICDTCSAELWRRTYTQDEYVRMGIRELLLKVQEDVKGDREQYAHHSCVIH